MAYKVNYNYKQEVLEHRQRVLIDLRGLIKYYKPSNPMGRAFGGLTQVMSWVGLGSWGWVSGTASLGKAGLKWAKHGLPNKPI